MDNNWEKYGREIRSIVDNAIHTQNFQQLNKNITDSVNGAVNDIQNGIRAAGQAVTEATLAEADAHQDGNVEGNGGRKSFQSPGKDCRSEESTGQEGAFPKK